MRLSLRFFLPIALALFLSATAFATDLTIGTIESPAGQLVAGRPVPVRFWVKNINRLDADIFDLAITIKDGSGNTVYSYSFGKTNLPKYDSALYTATPSFTPSESGTYTVSITVTYSEDIDHSNDKKTQTFTVLPPPPQLGTGIRQFSYFGPTGDSLSTIGIIQFTIPPKTKPCFLNVVIKRNDTSQAVWIVRNLLYMGPDFTPQNPIGMFIDLRRIGIQAGQLADSVILCVSCTETPISKEPKPDATCEVFQVIQDIYAVGPGDIERTADILNTPFSLPELPTYLPGLATLTDTVERGCTMPNLDLDSSTYNIVTTPGYKGDWNACAPTAAANSMEWLEKTHPELMNTGQTLREKELEISSYCNRDTNKGTNYDDFLKAKLAYIDKHKLPIKVKFQNMNGIGANVPSPDPRYGHSAQYVGPPGASLSAVRSPQWDWLVKEMQDSEDVELRLGWWKHGQKQGGHAVVVTGTAKINGVRQVRIKDDATQSRAGGTEMPSYIWDSTSSGFVKINELYDANDTSTCFLEAITAESFDTSVKFIESGVLDEKGDHSFYLALTKNPSLRSESVASDIFFPAAGKYRISITDINGREIVQLAYGQFDIGARRYYWDGKQNGIEMPAGIYLFTVTGNGYHESVKIIRY